MKLEIITYPNPNLYKKSLEVTVFDEALHGFLDDMYETMIAASGIGLAAIQVARAQRIFIINLLNDEQIQDPADKIEFINPHITPLSEAKTIYEEGCLSLPGFFEEVSRYEKIKIDYQDRYGKAHSLEASGLLAIAIQHENDHLDGHLFIEKISFQARKKFEKDFKKASKKQKSTKKH